VIIRGQLTPGWEPKLPPLLFTRSQISNGPEILLTSAAKRLSSTYLRDAAEDGFPCYPFFKVDKNLKNLWQNEEFKLFLAKQKKIYESHKKEFGKTSSTGG